MKGGDQEERAATRTTGSTSIVPGSSGVTPDQAAALGVARALATAGVPVFVAYPDPTSSTGYRPPKGWQTTTANPRLVDAWRPGLALCAVMGHGLDLVDVDPRNGGSLASLNGAMPTILGMASTPSGGLHLFVRSLGVRSRDNVMPGVDVKAGIGGEGCGFAFVAPTVRVPKAGGAPVAYRWVQAPDVAAMSGPRDDALAALVEAARNGAGNGAADDSPKVVGTPYAVAALAGALVDVRSAQQGERNVTLNRAAFGIGRMVPGLLDEGLVRAQLAAVGAETGLPPDEVEATITSGLAAGMADPHRIESDAEPFAGIVSPGAPPATRPFDGAGEGLSDGMLCATVARDVLAGRYRWVRGLGWLAWTDTVWAPVPDQAVWEETRRYLLAQWRAAVARLAKAQGDEDRKAAEALVSAWRGTLNKGRIGAITSLAAGIPSILTDAADLDRHPDLLNAGNGVVDLRTGGLGAHDPDLLMTRHTPVAYRPGARHVDWDATLEAVPGEVRDWLRIRYGQGATGHMPPDDYLVVQTGGGENGKTTFVGGIRGALGDYYVAISHRALIGDPSQHPTELMSFRGARVAVLEELPEEGRLSVVRLKTVVGTPTMKARLIRRDEVEFEVTHSLFLNSNPLPVVEETDHATWRRLARACFPYVFRKPGEPVTGAHDRRGDPNLRQRVQEGRQGQHEAVLAWLVDGAVAWYAADRIMPPLPGRVAEDTAEWRRRSDLLVAYADERLILDPGAHVPAVELFADFTAWLTDRGQRAWSDRTLSARIGGHSVFDVEKKNTRAGDGLSRRFPAAPLPLPVQYKAWFGVRFRQPDDSWPDDETAGRDGSVTAVTDAPVNLARGSTMALYGGAVTAVTNDLDQDRSGGTVAVCRRCGRQPADPALTGPVAGLCRHCAGATDPTLEGA